MIKTDKGEDNLTEKERATYEHSYDEYAKLIKREKKKLKKFKDDCIAEIDKAYNNEHQGYIVITDAIEILNKQFDKQK